MTGGRLFGGEPAGPPGEEMPGQFGAPSLSLGDAAAAAGFTTRMLAKLQHEQLLLWKRERDAFGIEPGLISVNELVRAAAFRHFEASRPRPDLRTRGLLATIAFDLQPNLIVYSLADGSVIPVAPHRLQAVVTRPGAFSVFDPRTVLAALGLVPMPAPGDPSS